MVLITDATRTALNPEFDYRSKLVKDGHFQRERVLTETTKRWIAQNISVDGEGVDWVLDPKRGLKKSNLTFMAKNSYGFWSIIASPLLLLIILLHGIGQC